MYEVMNSHSRCPLIGNYFTSQLKNEDEGVENDDDDGEDTMDCVRHGMDDAKWGLETWIALMQDVNIMVMGMRRLPG